MRFSWWAAALIATASGGAAQSVAGPVAIACEGLWYLGDPFGDSKVDRAETRRYILDEANNLVSYWNDTRELAIPLCDSDYQSCEITFEPTRILVSATFNSAGGHNFELNRRTGRLHFYWAGQRREDTQSFWGTCSPAEVPRANEELNRF